MSIVDQGALKFNQQGRLAPNQLFRLLPLILAGAILFLLAALFIVLIIVSAAQAHYAIGAIAGAGITFGGLALLFMWLGYVVGGGSLLDLLFGQVSQVEGVSRKDKINDVSYASTRRSGGVIYSYSVGKESFQLFRRTYDQLPKGIPVRAYYTPRSNTLVNIEPLQREG